MAAMNKKNLIINYLPQTLTDEEFTSLFSSIGQITTSKIVRDRATGYSYGFGFVEYELEQDAASAISLLNGTQLQNKTIKVAYSREGDNVKGANLHVRNIPKSYEVANLQEMFAGYGEIIQCRILTDQTTGKSRGMGFVLFNTKDEAERAMNALNGTRLPEASAPIQITFAEDKAKNNKVQQAQIASQTAAALINSYAAAASYMPMGYGAVPRSLMAASALRGAPRGRGGRGGPIKNQMLRQRFNPLAATGYGAPAALAAVTPQGHIIYAYNIGAQTSQEELEQLFSLYGTVSKVDVIWDHEKNQGKGYGFVTMPSYEEASYAIQCLNGYNYAGKPLQVSFKTPK